MSKSRTSKKRGFSFKDMPSVPLKGKRNSLSHSPSRSFKNRKEVALSLFMCLENNDPECFIEILDAYLSVNRSEIAEKANLARSTIQNVFSGKGNPTLRTIAQIVHEAVA